MSDAGMNDAAVAQFSVEVDGNKQSEHTYFADAIKEGLLLRGKYPDSKIKVRVLSQPSLLDVESEIAA